MTTIPTSAAGRHPSRTTLGVLAVVAALAAILLTVDIPTTSSPTVPADTDAGTSVSTYVEDFYFEPGSATADTTPVPPASTYSDDWYFEPSAELGRSSGASLTPDRVR